MTSGYGKSCFPVLSLIIIARTGQQRAASRTASRVSPSGSEMMALPSESLSKKVRGAAMEHGPAEMHWSRSTVIL